MRAKVVLLASVLALLILVPAIYLRFKPSSPATDQSAPTPQVVAAAPASPAPAVAHHPLMPVPANGGQGMPVPSAADLAAADHADYANSRQRELTQMGMSDDPSDLKIILTELNNKDPGIRKAALSATVQFGSTDAIPALQNEINMTDDPQEKVDILNAIKFLQLPHINFASGAPPQPSNDQPQPSNN